MRELCGRWGLEEGLAERAALLANELLANAVVHAGTALELRVELLGPRLYVAVHDQDPHLPRLLATENGARAGSADRGPGGHGLGVRQDPAGGKTVWCTLDLPAA